MTDPDALSDAIVAMLQAVLPVGGVVIDHDALPHKPDDIPDAGLLGVFLFEDAPKDGEGITDSAGIHERLATFKVEGRISKASHLLHSTKTLRGLIGSAVKANPFLGGIATDMRMGSMRVLVHETNSTIGAFVQDLHVLYLSQPE